jgi:hypothetical protein
MLVFMGSVSLVTGYQQKLDFSSLLQWLVRERSWIQTRGPLSRARGCVGRPSSRERWICSNLLATVRKAVTYVDCPQEVYAGRTWTGTGNLRVVDQVFPCRVYNNSNCHDSRIWVIACSWLPSIVIYLINVYYWIMELLYYNYLL